MYRKNFFVTTIKELPDKNFGIGSKTINKVKPEHMRTHKKMNFGEVIYNEIHNRAI